MCIRDKDTAKKHVPAQHKGRNALIAFISGCLLYTSPLAYLIEDYERIFHLIEETAFQSDALCRIRSDVEEACAAIKKLRRILMLVQPVSYTHLDVYKRQGK